MQPSATGWRSPTRSATPLAASAQLGPGQEAAHRVYLAHRLDVDCGLCDLGHQIVDSMHVFDGCHHGFAGSPCDAAKTAFTANKRTPSAGTDFERLIRK